MQANKHDTRFAFESDGRQLQANFDKMTQAPQNAPTKRRAIRRVKEDASVTGMLSGAINWIRSKISS